MILQLRIVQKAVRFLVSPRPRLQRISQLGESVQWACVFIPSLFSSFVIEMSWCFFAFEFYCIFFINACFYPNAPICFFGSNLTYSGRCLWFAQLLILLQGHVAQPYTRSFIASLQRFGPATCPMKFNKLNCVRHVAGTKYPPNWCCTVIKVSVHARGHVAATYPRDMYPQHFHVCANVVILSLLHVPATRPCYMSLQCVLHKFLSLLHVPATPPCYMSP